MLCAIASSAFAQLAIGTVDPGPYTPGSTIAATFTINNASCIAIGNTFQLYLSDASGNFGSETLIGTYNGFYATYVNGRIPAGITPGTGYKVRVKSTNPVLVSNESAAFEIKAGIAVEAKLSSVSINASNPETFGLCAGRDNYNYAITNESTLTSTVTATVKNELTGTATNMSFLAPIQIYNASLAHFTIFVKAVMLDGTVGTKAYFLINNQTVTAFSTSGNNVVCLPDSQLEFGVDIGTDGILKNFPGDTYVVNWGDQTTSTYTLCDIRQNAGKIKHLYTRSSCGNVFSGSSGTEYNVFAVNISVENPFCGRVGSTISSTAKVITKPVNSFTVNPLACTNTDVTFTNTSIQGEDPNTNSAGCQPNTVTYNWFVDGILVAANKPLSFNLVHRFTTHGNHVIRLESTSSGACDADPFEMTICVTDPPQPSFTLSNNPICQGATVTLNNTSVVDNICGNNTTYTWSISPNTGFTYAGGTNNNSQNPQITFNAAGAYTITLAITTGNCTSVSTNQQIVVNTSPTATLAADAVLCGTNTYNFNNTVGSITRTIFSGTTALEPVGTYTWTISAASGGTWSFVGGTNANSKYPQIKFDNFDVYTVTVTHTNNCGTASDSQQLSFNTAPTVDAGPDQSICYNDVSFTLAGSITGATTSRAWVGGSGTFFPDRNTLNATYTPTTAEKNAGTVTLTLRATTSLPAPCNQVDKTVVLTIKPRILVNSATTKSICTGVFVNYSPTSNTAGAAFSWTATGSATAGGFSASGSGVTINDVLTNSDATNNATVTYIITPSANGCTGDPFTLTVTVTPNPVLIATPANTTICSQQNAVINLSSNLAGTKYTWTSTATAGVTGNSNNATPSSGTAITNQLFNNTLLPGTVDYVITPISANGCPGAPVTVTITIEPPPTTPNAGADQSICNASSYVLQGNQPQVGTGKWTQVSAIGGVSFVDDTQYNTTVNGLVAGNTYIFRWTITGPASCAPKTDDVSIIVNPLTVGGTTTGSTTVCSGTNSGTITLNGQVGTILYWESSTNGGASWQIINNTNNNISYNNLNTTTQYRATVQSGACAPEVSTVATVTVNLAVVPSNAGPNQELCNQTSATLSGNSPLPNTGLWTQTGGPAGAAFVDATSPTTQVNGLVPGQTYIFTWTISGLAPCPPSASTVQIKVNLPSDGGTTAGSTSVCSGSGAGQITLSGQTGNIIRWESSTDGGTTWQIINTTASSINYANLTATTQYRAVVKNGNCASANSTIATITVNPGSISANAGPDQELCNQTSTTLAGNSPLTQTGLWMQITGPAVTFTDATLYNTTVSGLIPGQTYVFRWTISGLAPCPPSADDVAIKINVPSVGGTTTGSTTVCASNSNGTINLSGQTGNIIRWEQSTDGGTTWQPINNTTTSLNYTNLTVSTQYRAIVQNGNCALAISTVATVTVNQLAVTANAGPNQTLCNANSTTLSGNSPLTNTGLWTIASGQTGVIFADPTLFNTQVSGLVGGQVYTFVWTISGQAPCPSTSSSVTITNLAPIGNNTISTPELNPCTGQTISLTGSTPTGGNSTYTYVWESSPNGTTWTVINGQVSPSLNVTVNASLSYRRTVNSGNCSSISNALQINALPPIANNAITADQTICLGVNATTLTGSQPTGGNGTNYTFGWEQSTDNGTTWTAIVGASAKDYAPGAITQTTLYRRLVSSAACTGSLINVSNVIKIIVNPNARAEFTFTRDIDCFPFTLSSGNIKAVAYPDRNAVYTWYADNVAIGTGINFPGYTIGTANTAVVIKLVVTSSLGCTAAEMSHTFRTRQNVVASFTSSATTGCGPLTVDFTNTSNVTTGVTYEWRVNNVVVGTSADLRYEFLPDPLGDDKEYDVLLVVTSICGASAPFKTKITVIAKPIASSPPNRTTGCSPLDVTFKNISPGKTTVYQYEVDGVVVKPFSPDKSDFVYQFVTNVVREFKVRVTAKNDCDIDSREYIIVVSPNIIQASLTVNGNQLRGCAPFTVDFINGTTGANQYIYNFEPGQQPEIARTTRPETRSHTFTIPGTYTVTMLASNDCSTAPLQSVTITVDPQPTVAFKADLTVGCKGLAVKFANNSKDAVSYLWDFGDGETSTEVSPTHVYKEVRDYTVKLTGYNALNCPTTTTLSDYIHIVGPPKADFAIAPAAVISIPDYSFKFTNMSINGAQTYKWTFGDGDASTQRDPSHTYLDTGRFLVTLKAYNEQGCVDSTQKYVHIVGVPGYVYVPNSFMPGGNNVPLQKFIAVGTGIKSWKMSVFNKWGQVLWETTKLDDGKPVEGWDGTFNNVAQPQGIYFWKIEVQLINGTEWKGVTYDKSAPKRTGEIYLIR